MRNKAIILVFFLTMVGGNSIAYTTDTTLYVNLNSQWSYYDQERETYLPVIDGSDININALHFNVTAKEHEGTYLFLKSNKPLSLFINNRLYTVNDHLFWNVDSLLRKVRSQELHFTLYSNSKLDLLQLQTKLFVLSEEEISAPMEQGIVVISQRALDQFENFFIVTAVLLMVFLAALYNYYPRVTLDFFRFKRAIAIRELDENLLKGRPLTRINLLFYLFVSLMVALLLMVIVQLGGWATLVNVFQQNFWYGFLIWLQIGGIIFIWFILKYFLLSNFTSLFNLNSFLTSHYINYVRIGLFIFTTGIILSILSYFSFHIYNESYYQTLFIIFLMALSLRSIILFFKLMNSASYKILHLISYLCGTELIPLGIILYLGFNQPF